MFAKSTFFAIIIAVMIIILSALLLMACSLSLPWFSPICRGSEQVSAVSPHADDDLRRTVLEAEIASLERALAGRQCLPETPAQTHTDVIDEDRWAQGDVGLLEGCWDLDSDYSLRDIDTDEVLSVTQWQMCFDAAGNGSQSMTYNNGNICEADIHAQFGADGTLVVTDSDDILCSDGYRIFQREMTCELAGDGSANCDSRQPGRDQDSSTTVRLRR